MKTISISTHVLQNRLVERWDVMKPRNPHGVTETRTRDPSGGMRGTNRAHHGAALYYLISFLVPEFNLIGSFTWRTLPGLYRATTCRGREFNFRSHTYFFDHTMTWSASPDEGSAQCQGTSETAQSWKTIHTRHTLIHSNKVNMKMMVMVAKWYSRTLWAWSFLTFVSQERKPRKNSPRNLSRSGIELEPAAWQARMLPPVP